VRHPRVPAVLLLTVAAVSAAGATAAPNPSRSIVASVPVRDLALTGRSVAYVTDARPDELRCARVGLWNPATNRRYVFDAKEQCRELTSTGQGVWDVAVATNRLLWITYGGGNIREWTLWTATTTRRSTRQLRFVARDVDSAPPIVIGPGFHDRVPYAVNREVVLLGDDGRAIFKTTVPSPVRLIATGPGPPGCIVAVFVASGALLCLDRAGTVTPSTAYPTKSVKALGVLPPGAAIQVYREVAVVPPGAHEAPIVTLPRGATMVDVGQERVVWERAGDLGATTIASGTSVRLVDGSQARPVLGQLSPSGLAWAQGRVLRWRAGRLP
jgi:hypothetical protein